MKCQRGFTPHLFKKPDKSNNYKFLKKGASEGFTIIELLIYIAIFAVLSVTFSSILITFTRVNVGQIASNEVSSQSNFLLQTIQRMVGNASTIVVRSDADGIDDSLGKWDEEDSVLGQSHKYLVIKSDDEGTSVNDANSPIVIYRDADAIKVRKGRGSLQTISNLSTDRVKIDNLTFTKFINYPGRDVVEINLTISFKSNNPQQQVSRKLILGVSKAYAAIFDTSLLPGANNTADVGDSSKRWRDGYFAGDMTVGGNVAANTITLGGGTIINGLFNGSVSVDPPSIAADSNATFSVAAPTTIGASDRLFLTPPSQLEAGLVFVGARPIDATDEIEITLRNTSGASINGTSRNWHYLLLR